MERFRMTEFFAPLPLAAVLLMAVNDRYLKPLFHNAITGKLSDVAICFFLPLFTSAALGLIWRKQPRARLFVGAGLAAAFFVAQESWPAFSSAFLATLRFLGVPLGLRRFALTSDPSDLVALLLIPLAVAYGSRRLQARTGLIATSLSGSRRDSDG